MKTLTMSKAIPNIHLLKNINYGISRPTHKSYCNTRHDSIRAIHCRFGVVFLDGKRCQRN